MNATARSPAGRPSAAGERNGTLVIDVRSPAEFGDGHVEGAVNIEHPRIVEGIAAHARAPDTPIVVYCRSGARSEVARQSLLAAGYTHVTNGGGLEDMMA